jgi:uncharacterized OB-fold protein
VAISQRGFIAVEPDSDTAEWWAAVKEGRFTLPRCRACGKYFFPPLPTCPRCGSSDIELIAASGRGRIYSWVVIHRALDPVFAQDVPYTVVAVDLDEGPRMFGRFATDTSGPAAGAAVVATFYDVQGQRLIGFERSAQRSP